MKAFYSNTSEGATLHEHDGSFRPQSGLLLFESHNQKLELGTYDESAVMEKLQKRADELKKNPVGQNTLTNEEIQELAKKFDPQNMTQKEYDSFIR